MSLFLASVPFFDCLVRREFTRNLQDRQGEWLHAKAIGVECRRHRMLGFHVVFTGYDEQDKPVPTGGAMYRLPIKALAHEPCALPDDSNDYAPWDCLSDEFSVETLETIENSKVYVLPKRLPGRYMWTVQFGRSDLADDGEQGKQLHMVRLDGGWFGCFPNNRLLVEDAALFAPTTEKPDFLPLAPRFSGE